MACTTMEKEKKNFCSKFKSHYNVHTNKRDEFPNKRDEFPDKDDRHNVYYSKDNAGS